MASKKKVASVAVPRNEELLKHKVFFGGNRDFEDDDLKYEFQQFGTVVEYTRHKDRNCGFVTFYDADVAQSLIGEVLEFPAGAKIEIKGYSPQESLMASDIKAIMAARAKFDRIRQKEAPVAHKSAVASSSAEPGIAVPAKTFAWGQPNGKHEPVAPLHPQLFPVLNAGAVAVSTHETPITINNAPKIAPVKAKRAVAPPVAKVVAPPAPKPAPVPVGPIGLIGGTKVDVNIKEEDVPRFMAIASQISITLRVCNDTNSKKTLEAVTTEGPKSKAHAKIQTSVMMTDKTGQNLGGIAIGPQQSFLVSVLITTPETPEALSLNFSFRLQHKTVKHKVNIMVLEKLPERPVAAPVVLQYRPDQIKRRTVSRPAQFQTIRIMEHVPHFDNPESLFPLTEALKAQLELEKDVPLTNPPWTDRATYKQRMHNLLWMEEMEQQRLLRAFDLARTFMARHEDPCRDALLAIEVPSLSERRPTITIGDTLYAWIEGSTDVEYEGYIYQVRQAEIIVAFAPEFHNSVWKKDIKFTVRFTTSRHQFIVHHTAVEKVDLDVIWPDASLPPLKPEKRLDVTQASLADVNIGNCAAQFNTVKLGLNNRCSEQNVPLLVFGPFGTGKTKTLVELVYQICTKRPSARVLVCALSNSAADVLTLRLTATSMGKSSNLIRLYSHTRKPYQVANEIQPFTFMTAQGEYGVPPTAQLSNYRIVVSTCNNTASLFGKILPGHFTHIIIDEAAQLLEADALIPLTFATRSTTVVMAGDPQQLQFRSQSNAAALKVLSLSIMQRLHVLPQYIYVTKDGKVRPNPDHFVHLNENFRSHPAILKFASEQFYGGSLVPRVDVQQLPPLGLWENISNEDHPMAFLPVQGVEQCEDDSPSFFNELEATSVTLLVQSLLQDPCAKGLKQNEIGIISPFFKQTKRIRDMLRMVGCSDVQVSSIADLQGREFKALFVSTVRTSKKHLERDALQGLGFINSPNALNSVLTRSRALLVVVGDPFTVAQDDAWNRYMSSCLNNGTYWDEPLTPQEIAKRQEDDERRFNAPALVVPASQSRIDPESITFTKEISAAQQLLDDPFAFQHDSMAALGSLGNPALAAAAANGVASSSSMMAPSAASSASHTGNNANGNKRMGISAEHSQASPYVPSASAARSTNAQGALPKSILRMDNQDFLQRVAGFDAPQLVIASTDTHLEVQVACLGLQPIADKVGNIITLALEPIAPQGHLLWNSSTQPQRLEIIIPAFSVHFDYQVSQASVRFIFHRQSTLTPQVVPDRYAQGRMRD